MRKVFFLLLIIVLTVFIACKSKADSMRNDQVTLNGQIFHLGPTLDSLKVESFAEGDCSSTDVAFINDSQFVARINCLHNNSYFKGHYMASGDTIRLISDPLIILAEVDESSLNDGMNKINLRKDTTTDMVFFWTKTFLKNKQYYITNMDSLSYATKRFQKVDEFMKDLKNESDSIPILLGLK